MKKRFKYQPGQIVYYAKWDPCSFSYRTPCDLCEGLGYQVIKNNKWRCPKCIDGKGLLRSAGFSVKTLCIQEVRICYKPGQRGFTQYMVKSDVHDRENEPILSWWKIFTNKDEAQKYCDEWNAKGTYPNGPENINQETNDTCNYRNLVK